MRARERISRDAKNSAANASVMRHGERACQGAGVEGRRMRDSLLFHFISAFFCSNLVGRMTRMSAAESLRSEREKEKGKGYH